MLWVCWLLFKGSLDQARINWDVPAPVTGISTSIFYGSGLVFAVSAAVLIARELWLALAGQLSEAELVMVKESEEQAELEALQAELAREDAARAGSRP
jgi:TRAP-type C4-dicarboxylate transport system permease small subunit